MKISLPKDIAEKLPAPDDEGIVRVTAGLKIGPDGKADLLSLNDSPLPTDKEEEDDESPAADLPPASEMDLGDDGEY